MYICEISGPYGRKVYYEIEKSFKTHANVSGKHVLVIGSETPWIELLALRNGATKVTSVDYLPVKNDHPNINFVHALDFNRQYSELFKVASVSRRCFPCHPPWASLILFD